MRQRVTFFFLCLVGFIFIFSACKERHFIRPGGVFDLGEVRHILFQKQYITDKSLLVHRDQKGWSVLSGRCSYDGCDLTYQEQTLLCSCCYSEFTHYGKVIKGPSTHPLPWFSIRYKDNHLYALTGKVQKGDYRFTTPEIEQRLYELRKQIKEEGAPGGVKIPRILLGRGFDDEEEDEDELRHLPDDSTSTMTDTYR